MMRVLDKSIPLLSSPDERGSRSEETDGARAPGEGGSPPGDSGEMSVPDVSASLPSVDGPSKDLANTVPDMRSVEGGISADLPSGEPK